MKPVSPDPTIIRQWLLEANYRPILELAKDKKSVLSLLTALTYDDDRSISDRAVEVTGLVARIISKSDPEYVRNYLLRLFWLVNDESGGICWRAPELIGEILYNCPDFRQFFPMLISILDLEKEDAPRFRAGTLWAIGRVAQVAKAEMLPALQQVQTYISWDKETHIREMAAWCEKQLIADEG